MNLKASGVPHDDILVLHMRDHGVDLYGNAIIANPEFMRDEPKALAFTQKYFGAIPRPTRKLNTTYTEEPPQDGEIGRAHV